MKKILFINFIFLLEINSVIAQNVGIGPGSNNPAATVDVFRNGLITTANFRGTENTSHFNFIDVENSYIRGGKSTSSIYIGGGTTKTVIENKVGIGLVPQANLDLNGKIKIGDDGLPPVAGMIRWNSQTLDFEGYDGTKWLSLLGKN